VFQKNGEVLDFNGHENISTTQKIIKITEKHTVVLIIIIRPRNQMTFALECTAMNREDTAMCFADCVSERYSKIPEPKTFLYYF
jgi:hypothetical protein